ncbi:MAG: hypothetical protein AAB917_00665 [Patescibacteria group bacterium]
MNSILAGTFIFLGIVFVLSLILHVESVSQSKKFWSAVVAIISIFGILALFVFSPRSPRARDVVQIHELSPGLYELQDVWKIDRRFYALIRPARLVTDPTDVSPAFTPITGKWTLCDISLTTFAGEGFGSKEYNFTSVVQVFKVGQKTTLKPYIWSKG